MTSLLREDTPLPMPEVASATTTSCPAVAAARATASPTTPAPTTRTCICPALPVTRGLDPRVHRSAQEVLLKMMDCRVKPGNDEPTLDQHEAQALTPRPAARHSSRPANARRPPSS